MTWNSIQFNESTYNGAIGLTGFNPSDFDLLKFGTTNLSDGTNIVVNSLKYLSTQQNFSIFDLGDYRFINNTRYTQDTDQKIVVISGVMKKSTRADLIEYIETIKGDIIRQENNLYIKDGGVIKFGLAYCQNISFSENYYDITRMSFEIQFIILRPLMEYDTQNVSGTSISSASSVSINNTGQNYADYYAIITLNASGAITNPGIKINDVEIYTIGTYADGDIMILDSHNLYFGINGTEVNYQGEFERIGRGSNSLELYNTSPDTFDLNFSRHNTFR